MKRTVFVILFTLFIPHIVLAVQKDGIQVETLVKTGYSWDMEALPNYPLGSPEITILRIKIPAGVTLPMHKHPVINAGYMLKGRLKVVTEDGKTFSVKAGEAIVEVVNKWHYGVNESKEDAEILVFYAGEAGKAITINKQTYVSDDFVDVTTLDGSFILDIRYATTNNFTGKVVYPTAKCYLRRAVAERLVKVQRYLKGNGLKLVLFDCYRPLSVQERFWEIMPDGRYVADPKKGSRHNRGAAVDVSLADINNNYLEMPSEFDDFSERAHRDYAGASDTAKKNRLILEEAMAKFGFEGLPTEWWHFDAVGWEKYPISDDAIK
jgi:D-alanyl-D-alanine dipeptidase